MGDNDSGRPWILSEVKPYPEQATILHGAFRVVLLDDFDSTSEQDREKIQGILLFPPANPAFTEEFFRSLPNLKVIASHSAGISHLDLPLLRRLGLKASRARGVLDDPCADFIFGLLISAARRLPECMALAHGQVDKNQIQVDPPTGVKVSGATIGILGMGAIGCEVARRAAGFKMKVLYHNRTQRNREEEAEVKAIYYPDLDEMLPEVDYLVITASLNPDSRHIIGNKQIQLMKSSAIIVNGARGQVIDQDALVEALRNGTIRGAALDVTDPEPLPKDHPLLVLPNAIVTAHLAACEGETLGRMMQNCVDNLLAGIEGRPLPTEVEPQF